MSNFFTDFANQWVIPPAVNVGAYFVNSAVTGIGKPQSCAVYAGISTIAQIIVGDVMVKGLIKMEPTIKKMTELTLSHPIVWGACTVGGTGAGIYIGKKVAKAIGGTITNGQIGVLAGIFFSEIVAVTFVYNLLTASVNLTHSDV